MKTLLLTFFIVLSFNSFGQAPRSSLTFGELSDKVVKLYPNPAVSVINFEFGTIEKGLTLQIFSVVGKKIIEVPVVSQKTSVPLNNDFFRGIYIFQLRDKSGKMVESGKFQVAR